MKMLVLSNLYPSKREPSFGVFVENFCNEWIAFGGSILLVTIKGKSGKGVYKLIRYFMLFVKSVVALLFRKYDVIYVHYGSHPLVPLIFLRFFISKPFIINFHGEDLVGTTGVEPKLRPLLKQVIEKADLIVLPSTYFLSIFSAKYKNANLLVSPSGGIDLSLFKPSMNMVPEDERVRIGFVARIERGKGWQTLIAAIEELVKVYSFTFVVDVVGVGGDDHLMRSEIQAKQLQDFFVFHGEMNHEQLAREMRKFRFFVAPSELNESLGLAGLEAMASGVPVIASNLPAFMTYVKHGLNGWVFEKSNSKALYMQIFCALKMSNSDYINMRNHCLATASDFDSKMVARVLFEKIWGIKK